MPDHNPISTTTPIGVGPLGIALHADRKKRHSTRSAFACLRASAERGVGTGGGGARVECRENDESERCRPAGSVAQRQAEKGSCARLLRAEVDLHLRRLLAAPRVSGACLAHRVVTRLPRRDILSRRRHYKGGWRNASKFLKEFSRAK
jgi:hypothetical protein